MEIKCPECGNSAAQILIGTDNHRYAKCLECGEVTPAEPPQPATLPLRGPAHDLRS
jgi:uncharacterized Zn finger protein